MSGGQARYGRRDNGLVAAEYSPAGDVDPRVGEHLLDVLAVQGIAAYLRPSSDLHPVTRSSILPSRPTDRLYVDRAHLNTAQAYLAQLGGGTDATSDGTSSATSATDDDQDEQWSKIVAGFDAEVAERSRTWPAAEDLSAERGTTDRDLDRTPRRQPTPPPTGEMSPPSSVEPEGSLLDALDTFGAGLPDQEEGEYTPPIAPPLPRPTLQTIMAIIGISAGLLIFFQPDLLPFSEGLAMFFGVAALIAGFGSLVLRLRPGNDDDDIDPDHGARV